MATFWENMEVPSRKRANNVIKKLRDGVPSKDDVSLFAVGHRDLFEYFERALGEITEYDMQGIKFIQADYGHGKTHFLYLLAQLALHRNFIVSIVSLDRRKAPLNKLEMVLPLIMGNIMTPNASQGGLARILQEWARSVQGLDSNSILQQIDEDEGLQLLFPDFRMKLSEYARSYNRPEGPNHQACLLTENWFRGEGTPSKRVKSVSSFLSAFVQLVRHLGYNGFVAMLDEAESITMLSRITNRDQANENLRQIIDNQDMEGFYFVFASTPSFLDPDDDRGAKSYPALWRRISDPLGNIGQSALDKVIIELPPLSEDEFTELSKRIKFIYEIAQGRQLPQVEEEHLRSLAEYVQMRTDRSVRTLVRSTVALLDEARQTVGLDVDSNYELIVERILEDEERRQTIEREEAGWLL